MFFCLASCIKEYTKYTDLQIEGIVTDKYSHLPIQGAEIKLKKITGWTTSDLLKTTKTNQEGHYNLKYSDEDCSERNFHISAIAIDGYSQFDTYYDFDSIHVRCTETIQTIDFEI